MKTALGVLVFVVAAQQAACFDPFHRGTLAGGSEVPDEVSYEGDVYPILLSYCSSCHADSGIAASSNFVLSNNPATDYDQIAGLADDGSLLSKAAGTTAHGGGGVLSETSVEFRTLQTWIEQGAGND